MENCNFLIKNGELSLPVNGSIARALSRFMNLCDDFHPLSLYQLDGNNDKKGRLIACFVKGKNSKSKRANLFFIN